MRSSTWRLLSPIAVAAPLLLTGCTRDHRVQFYSMWNDSRYKPYEPSGFFPSGSSSQQVVPGTVARGQLREDDALYTGRVGGKLVATIPFAVTPEVLSRGQQRFNIYCSPCHGRLGDGQGMVVKRGFAKPPDYTIARLRNAPAGHFYDVITNGYGAMYSYASRVKPGDRWAIAAYIRVLQQARPGTPPEVKTPRREQPRPGEGAEGQQHRTDEVPDRGAPPVAGTAPSLGTAPTHGTTSGGPAPADQGAPPATGGTSSVAGGGAAGQEIPARP